MTCYKFFLMVKVFLILPCYAELAEISDDRLSMYIGQSGVTIDQTVSLSFESIMLDLEGSEGVTVITGNLFDNIVANDRGILDFNYRGLAIDVSGNALEIGMPTQLTINNFNVSIYTSNTTNIIPTTYTSEQQTYTAYINSVSDDPVFEDFTLTLTGANFDSTGSGTFTGSYQENLNISNIDGASATFTVSDISNINISVESSDRSDCGFFCDGTDDGEIIILDSNGDLVALSSSVGEDASLVGIEVKPISVVDTLGSNFFISAKMSGTFDLTGNLHVFSGTEVQSRY